MDTLKGFVQYALLRGYEASLNGKVVTIANVSNYGNDFLILKRNDGLYSVTTVHVSERGYSDLAKCKIYLLIAEYYKAVRRSHDTIINFPIQI